MMPTLRQQETRTTAIRWSALPVEISVAEIGGGRDPHEVAVLHCAAGRLAELFGARRVAAAAAPPPCGRYWIPSSTLSRREAAALGISDGSQLWGGIVPAGYVATKLVSHPRSGRRAAAPKGWIDIIGLEDCTLPGWSVFSRADALAAGAELLRGGPVRVKPPRERGGRGQRVVRSEEELGNWLDAASPRALEEGLVLERDLVESTTYSVGFSVLPGGHRIAYVGTQRTVITPQGVAAYGGSRLEVVRGTFADLEATLRPGKPRAAVQAASRYDAVIRHAYGVVATRCNYDVIAGIDRLGRRHLGVLEQSWRFGGASMAELLAIERFTRMPGLQRVVAETVETFAGERVPAEAVMAWRGDARSPCKYARIVEEASAGMAA
ncbi:DUF3182 family protein [Thermomonas sp. XSG]|uniref:DUF3182 family protein n=1 Tax=Thermomonas sp. XSG TaxID=2771436 RepID=UPI0016819616|nr:DUF3182 family protein [Thermomonas sp. XSG]QNU15949.1 DUF3182 family protein [Thermomonas sp. XSG]